MIAIACVDDDLGLMFNNRRQTRDKKVIEDIMSMIEGKKLWISDYSQALFDLTKQLNINVKNDFMDIAGEGEYVFVENTDIKDDIKVEKIILYCWNRKYPSDKKFSINFLNWIIAEECEFQGSSHELITKKEYIRRENNGKEEEK